MLRIIYYMKLTPNQLHILQHSLGCDKYGETSYRGGRDEGDGCFGCYHRNRYICNAGNPDIDALVAAALMQDCGSYGELTGGMHLYMVTKLGVSTMREQSPKAPRLSRAAQRYRSYLRSDCGYSFLEWLRFMEAARKDGRLLQATGSDRY